MQNAKLPSLFLVPCFLFLSLLLSGCVHRKATTPPVKERPKIQETVNTVPVEKRVYTTLSFPDSGRFPVGRELRLTVADGKGASAIDYELEYQAGTLVQAGLGSIDTAKEKPPFVRDILLGSCSAGGACSYSDDVKGGTLLLRFKGSETGNLKGEWNYYAPGNDGKFSSRDAKFQLSAPKLKNSFVIVSQTLGLPASPTGGPAPVAGEVLAGPYHVEMTASSVGEMAATIHLSKEGAAKLWHWDGKTYREIPSSVSGKTLTARLKESGTYLAVE